MRALVNVILLLAVILLFAEAARAQTDVVIAIDLSKSMQRNDPNGNRFTGADQCLTFFSAYGNNRGGVVAFGDSASDVIRLEYLSFDQAGKYKPILDKLGSEDWTELGKGLNQSKDMFGSSGRKRSIILISDGIVEGNPHARGMSRERAKDEAEKELWGTIVPALKLTKISVYTIGLFAETSPGEATLQKLALETGGFYTHVENPDEFTHIYKRMLDDIDQPSGVAELSNESNSIVLTPFDDGVIVFGPTRFVVRAPNDMTYSTDKATPDTPVKQRFFEYKNNTAILFLGRPDNVEQNGQFWNGKWSVQFQDSNGKGEATFISNVRLVRDPEQQIRRDFFLNEFYMIKYLFRTQPGFDSEKILSNCRAEFVVIPEGQSKAKSALGTMIRQGSVFTGERLLDNEGNYMFEIKVFYQDGNIARWTHRDHFHVNKTSLAELLGPSEPAQVGSIFKIEAKNNAAASAGFSNDFKGLVDSSVMYTLRYGSDVPISLEKTSPDSDGVYRSEELKFQRAGNLEIDGILRGKLLMQVPVENAEPKINQYDVKARVFKKLTVENTFWGLVWGQVVPWGVTGLSLFASLLGIFGYFIQRPKFDRLDRTMLIGNNPSVGAISLKPQGMSEGWRKARWFTRRSSVTVGGPQSKADVKYSGIGGVKGHPAFEIGVNGDGKYHIISNGSLEVYLNSDPLEPNQPRTLNPNDEIKISGVGSFRFFS